MNIKLSDKEWEYIWEAAYNEADYTKLKKKEFFNLGQRPMHFMDPLNLRLLRFFIKKLDVDPPHLANLVSDL